jgi:hypothetical protein
MSRAGRRLSTSAPAEPVSLAAPDQAGQGPVGEQGREQLLEPRVRWSVRDIGLERRQRPVAGGLLFGASAGRLRT